MSLASEDFAGRLIITWPKAAAHPVISNNVILTDADTGDHVTAAMNADILIHAEPGHVVTATLEMVMGTDGKPLTANSKPDISDDGENIRTAVFVWLVAEMRVAE